MEFVSTPHLASSFIHIQRDLFYPISSVNIIDDNVNRTPLNTKQLH
jgi:hypothetical protein